MKKKNLELIAIVLFLLIIGLVSYLSSLGKKPEESGIYTFPRKPMLMGKFVKNPDFFFNSTGWLAPLPENLEVTPLTLNDTGEWEGTGFAFWMLSPILDRTGVIIIHPINVSTSRYVQQTVYLPEGNSTYYLVFGVANVAKIFGPTGCDDNVFRLTIKDLETGESFVIFERAINKKEGWKDFGTNITRFKGKRISIKLEGIAGGPCGNWKGEWGAVDYIDILPILPFQKRST